MAGPRTTKTYNLRLCVLTIGGRRIEGHGDDSWCTVEAPTADLESSVGGGGEATYSRTNDDRMGVTVSCRENSLGCKTMGELRAQQRAEDAILPLPFILVDPLSGDELESEWVAFMNTPGISKGKSVGNRDWELELPYGKESIRYAQNVTR